MDAPLHWGGVQSEAVQRRPHSARVNLVAYLDIIRALGSRGIVNFHREITENSEIASVFTLPKA